MGKKTRVLREIVCDTCKCTYTHWHYSSKFCSKECYHKSVYRRWQKKGINKSYALDRLYGLSQDQYARMILEQEGKCFLCETVPKTTLCVDHDHETGLVRKLLCRSCNMALGLVKDNPKTIAKMFDYVKDLKSVRG